MRRFFLSFFWLSIFGIIFFYSSFSFSQNSITPNGKVVPFDNSTSGATRSNFGGVRIGGHFGGTPNGLILNNLVIGSDKFKNLSITNSKIADSLRISNGGTGKNSFVSGQYLVGTGSQITQTSTIPIAAVSGIMKSLNAVSSTIAGDLTVTLNSLTKGTLAERDALTSPSLGSLFVIDGDPSPANNGNLFSYGGSNWSEIDFSSPSFSSRYLSLTGGTLQGNLIIPVSNTITINSATLQSTSVVNKGFVDTAFNSIPLATRNRAGFVSTDDLSKLNNLPTSFNTALLSSRLAYWDGIESPTLRSYPIPNSGYTVSASSPTWLNLTKEYKLNDDITFVNGYLSYNFTHLPFMKIKFKMKAVSTGINRAYRNTGNGIFLYCFADAIPLTEFGNLIATDPTTSSPLISKGYTICFSEYARRIEIRWGGSNNSALWDTTQIVGGYQNTDSNPGTTNASSSPANLPTSYNSINGIDIADGNWHDVKIYFIGRRIIVYWDNTLMLNTVDKVFNRDLTGTNFGFVARTGAAKASHFIKGFTVDNYIDEVGINEF